MSAASTNPTDFMDLKPVIMPGVKRGSSTAQQSILARAGAGATSAFRKLDGDVDGAPKQKKVETESRQAMIRARVEKGWTQDQADAHCNFPKHTFKAIENGTLTPTGQMLGKISRNLKVDLKLV
jgi:ribosome-binding protein aMBF1 (putative translation factor)